MTFSTIRFKIYHLALMLSLAVLVTVPVLQAGKASAMQLPPVTVWYALDTGSAYPVSVYRGKNCTGARNITSSMTDREMGVSYRVNAVSRYHIFFGKTGAVRYSDYIRRNVCRTVMTTDPTEIVFVHTYRTLSALTR